MNPTSFNAFSASIERLRQCEQPFVLATIVRVQGSASAKVGSKAIFDETGKNIFGWVGGGCAERFIGEQAIASLKEKKGRVVTADLDDEIFGLGVACGGTMDVFIDPILQTEEIQLPESWTLKQAAEELAEAYEIKIKWVPSEIKIKDTADLFLHFAEELARLRERSGKSLKEVKNLPVRLGSMNLSHFKNSISIVGRGRIIESLARHFSLLDWSVRFISMDEAADAVYEPGDCVLIATHSARDREFVRGAVAGNVAYVGMVGSRKRALEVIEHLDFSEEQFAKTPLYIPAGVDMDTKNPNEIGLSIVVEILKELQARQ